MYVNFDIGKFAISFYSPHSHLGSKTWYPI